MSTKLDIKKGYEIFKEGNFSDCAYIVEKGRVEIFEIAANGEKMTLGILQENEIFGEMGLIDKLPRSASARALEDSIVHVLTRETFEFLLKQHPKFLMPILKVLSIRLRGTLDMVNGDCKVPKENHRQSYPKISHPSFS